MTVTHVVCTLASHGSSCPGPTLGQFIRMPAGRRQASIFLISQWIPTLGQGREPISTIKCLFSAFWCLLVPAVLSQGLETIKGQTHLCPYKVRWTRYGLQSIFLFRTETRSNSLRKHCKTTRPHSTLHPQPCFEGEHISKSFSFNTIWPNSVQECLQGKPTSVWNVAEVAELRAEPSVRCSFPTWALGQAGMVARNQRIVRE